jgi:hypothetical protein
MAKLNLEIEFKINDDIMILEAIKAINKKLKEMKYNCIITDWSIFK